MAYCFAPSSASITQLESACITNESYSCDRRKLANSVADLYSRATAGQSGRSRRTTLQSSAFLGAVISPRSRQQQVKSNRQIRSELGGHYEEDFGDVDKYMINCFTLKAIKVCLAQLQEMNPPQYANFYNFVVNNNPQDGKFFIQALVKENQELAERVMVTRLHLFNKWAKTYNPVSHYLAIKDENLGLLRERLTQTVRFATEDEQVK